MSQLEKDVKAAKDRMLFKCAVFSSAYNFVVKAQFIAGLDDSPLAEELNDLDDVLRESSTDTSMYIRSLLFVDLVSEVEVFFASLVKSVITLHPKKLGQAEFKLAQILDVSSIDELIFQAAEEYIHRIMYMRPRDYLREICKTLSVKNEVLQPYWSTYIEAKARRDLGMHNNWICNTTYIHKCREEGIATTYREGECTRALDDEYAAVLNKAVADLSEALSQAVLAKHGTPTLPAS